MTDYSGLMVFLLLLPVVIQILLPLMMLAGYCFFCVMKIVFGRRKAVGGAKEEFRSQEELQFSTN